MPVEIRLATHEDLALLEWDDLFWSHRQLIHAAYRRQQRGTVAMLVATKDAYPIGQAWVDFRRRAALHAGLIWAVRVHPTVQNNGVGERLLGVAEQVIRHAGLAISEVGVEKANSAAQRFYSRLGYGPVGELCDVTCFSDPDGVRQKLFFDQWRLQKPL